MFARLTDPPFDPAPWLARLDDRFGIAPATFDGYVFFRPNDKLIYIASGGLTPPAAPEPVRIGMAFLKTNIRFPKLTTQAAMAFGHAARRHVVALDADQIAAYIRHETIQISTAQAQACTEMGYVFVRYRGRAYGLGLYLPADRLVQSLFPKTWAGVQVGHGAA